MKTPDGLYGTGKGRGRAWFFVKDQILWVQTKIHPLVFAIDGHRILSVQQGRRHITFVRAADAIQSLPRLRENIEATAKDWEIST